MLIDTNSSKVLTGTFQLGFGAPNGNIPPTVTDPSANYPVSTMIELCYAGSDNGAGGAAGCPSGSAPSGYIPPSSSSPSLEQPAASITTGVVAAWSGLPSGFCTSANLQSSNSSGACYMPASGVGCLTDQNYDETVNYTYNSSTQQITLQNLNFVHSNAMVFATGGLCGYAAEVNADIYTATGTGGSGVQSQVFPIEGSINNTTFYYMPRRTNEGYGPAILGLSTDQDRIGSGQLSFTTGSSGYSLGADGHTVTFTLNQPSNVGLVEIYNQLPLNISTPSNTSYSVGSPFIVTWVSGNNFTYQLATPPTGSAPASGTVSYSNLGYTLYPAATILSAYNPVTSQVDGTVTVMPNTVAWGNGDSIRVPHYQQMDVTSAHYGVNQWIPGQSLGGGGFDITYNGTALSPGEWGFALINQSPAEFYQGYGGTHVLPDEAEDIQGVWGNTFDIGYLPNQSLFQFDSCKPIIGCSAANSNFHLFQMPILPNSAPGANSFDSLNYDPNYQSAVRPQGLYSGRWFFGNQFPVNTEGSTSVATIEAGYVNADQSMTTPTVSTSSLATTQLTYIQNVALPRNGSGSIPYQYYIVGHTPGGGTTLPQTVGLITNTTLGSPVYNLICAFQNPGFSSYDILKGDTAHSIITGLSATSPNGTTYMVAANLVCFADYGGATSTYTPPTSNTTGSANILGSLNVNGNLTVGGGTPVTSIKYYSASLTPTSVAADTCSKQTFTITGVLASDNIGSIKPPSGISSSLFFQGYISAANTLTITFCNIASSATTPTSGMYSFLAMH